jgi:hypothetical protein
LESWLTEHSKLVELGIIDAICILGGGKAAANCPTMKASPWSHQQRLHQWEVMVGFPSQWPDTSEQAVATREPESIAANASIEQQWLKLWQAELWFYIM